MPLEAAYLLKFGDFCLDIKEKLLAQGEKTIPLTPKVFELLVLFLENHGRLLEKDEIIQKLWKDSFVEESNLTFNIRQLRKILEDNAQKPKYIETVWGHGYRFIASVQKVVRDTSAPKVDEVSVSQVEENSAKKLSEINKNAQNEQKNLFTKYGVVVAIVIILSIITAVVATTLIWGNFRKSSAAPILAAEYKSTQLTNAGGVYEAAISPDGEIVVYLNEIGGKTGIWLKNFSTGENTQIMPNTEDAYYGLGFSKDGKEIFFSRGPKIDESRKINIYRVSVFGGIPKEIISDVRGLFSISPDNQKISFIRCLRQDNDFCSLFIADIDGKNEQKLLTRPRPIRMEDNQFSPDGKSIAVALGQSRSSSSEFGIVEVDINSKTEREITNHKFSTVKYLQWLPDKSGLLVSAFEPPHNAVRIFRVSTNSNEVQLLTKDAITYDCLSLDRSAKRLVTTQITDNFRLWTAPVTQIDEAKPLSHAAAPMYYGQNTFTYTKDNKIIYAAASDANQHLWIMNSDGTDQRQLTSGQGANWQPRLSKNQSTIIFASNRTGFVQIWQMNIDGSNQKQISEGEGGNRPIHFSSDGKTIYFESARNSTLGKLFLSEEGKINSNVISNERMFQPEINSKEDTVAYFSRGNSPTFQISLMSLADGKILKTLPLGDEKSFPIRIIWSLDEKTLFYLMRGEKKYVVWQFFPETGKSLIFAELGEEAISDIALSPDGKSLSFIRGKEFHDAFLIEGLK